MIIFRRRFAGLSENTLLRFVTLVRRTIPIRLSVNIVLTSDAEMQSLNRRFRGKNEPTDVLSFPSPAAGKPLGEIAISVEMARRNAERLGHSSIDEVKILVLHGMLHLAGYDHESDSGEMLRAEDRLRKTFGLPRGLIERSLVERSLTEGRRIKRRSSPRTVPNLRRINTRIAGPRS